MRGILESCEGLMGMKHKVSKIECEQLFFNSPLIIADDEKIKKDSKV